jgi:hypothetical protein
VKIKVTKTRNMRNNQKIKVVINRGMLKSVLLHVHWDKTTSHNHEHQNKEANVEQEAVGIHEVPRHLLATTKRTNIKRTSQRTKLLHAPIALLKFGHRPLLVEVEFLLFLRVWFAYCLFV